jgi:hypothetical protein
MELHMPISGDKYEFTSNNVNSSPAQHGVYQLYDGDVTIYIGRASGTGVTIRSRLQNHYSGNEGPCTQGATHYRGEVTEYAIAREKELLDEYYRINRRLPRCNDVRP